MEAAPRDVMADELAPPISFAGAPDEHGLSLEQMTAAFAEMLGGGDDPYRSPPATEPSAAVGELPLPAQEPEDVEDACEICPRTILEAMLFVGRPDNAPLTAAEVAALMRGVRAEEIDDLVRELNERYAANACPYEIISEGAGYRLVLRPEYDPLRDKFYGRMREVRLSQAAIDILSLVAYHQPITAEEVSHRRGKPSGAILAQLVRRELLRVERADDGSRKQRYATTDRFLELFGLSSLADLPRQEDVTV